MMVASVACEAQAQDVAATSGKSDEPAVQPASDPHKSEPSDTGWAVQLDQDVFWPPSADKDFTQGTQFEWSGQRTRGWFPRQIFHLIDWPAGKLLHDKALRATTGAAYESNVFQLGFSGFTPRKGDASECAAFAPPRVNKSGEGCVLSDTAPLFDDRPYAGLLYVRTRRSSVRERSAWVSELTLGLLGTNIGKGVQTFVHRHVSHDVAPGGWHHQISDGMELTGKYRLAHRWAAFAGGCECSNDAHVLDVSTNAEGNLGYYTNIGGHGRVRLGLLRSTPLTIEVHGSDPSLPRQARAGGWLKEAYVWGTWGGFLWGYNALLQGQFRKTDVALSFDDGPARLRRFGRTWQAGATIRAGRVTATYNVTWQSPVFDGPNSRTHSWGTVLIQFLPKAFAGRAPRDKK